MKVRVILAMVLLAACSQDGTPEGMLDKERFTRTLAGATLIEARMNNALTSGRTFDVQHQYDSLFAANGTDEASFKRTFDHYAARPGELQLVYEEVLALLSQWKDEAVQGAPMTKADTLATDSVKGVNR